MRKDELVAELQQVEGVAKIRADEAISNGFITVRNVAGVISVAMVAVLLIGGAAAYLRLRGSNKPVWTARMLAVGAMCIALSSVLSNVKLFSMPAQLVDFLCQHRITTMHQYRIIITIHLLR